MRDLFNKSDVGKFICLRSVDVIFMCSFNRPCYRELTVSVKVFGNLWKSCKA